MTIGRTRWVIPEGYIPGSSTGSGRETAALALLSAIAFPEN